MASSEISGMTTIPQFATLSTGLASKSFRVSASNALCLGDERVIAALFVGLGGIS